jgi:hypothetical protein
MAKAEITGSEANTGLIIAPLPANGRILINCDTIVDEGDGTYHLQGLALGDIAIGIKGPGIGGEIKKQGKWVILKKR